ncbi:MAG: hypothetical protein HS124_03400 [Anaerolineales bacterium]|nr:hypothetical protein [Anaerolineales bacterium]MCL4260776.1 hypothetical protein [Anaerolineales bacterium]
MEAILAIVKNNLKKPVVAIVLGAALGLILGLILGWLVWPVEYTDGTPEILRADLQRDYLRMTIDSYNRTGDVDAAMKRWDNLGAAAGSTFVGLQNDLGYLDAAKVREFGQLVQSVKGAPIQTAAPEPGALSGFSSLIFYAAIAVVALLIGAGALFVLRLFRRGSGTVTPVMQATEISRNIERTDYQKHGLAPPITQTMTTYVYGYDLYDESFSIDTQGGKYLGEYGVGICEKIGVGEPKKVAALEVWLFEENDIKTATKVLMSEHAYNDPTIRAKLEPKGELIPLKPGGEILLETANLQLLATVVDLEYGMGSLPANSYFQRVTLEFAIWPRATH